ncbi:37S ribosomal protein S9 [Daldinia decipiens]|uniref:37S ribosomal protein S9 n=1 Tax=Daldinia decipiens TaxID=326647 RepID=UPI0020C560CD|nr:37S ribosomal protein S9 [Daldinia decipiens]KAI1662955.1 37S ribosomal protein S9 [Daldinia decipiens]
MSSLRYGLRCLRDLRATATRQPSLSASINACMSSETHRTFTTTTTARQDDAFSRLEAAIARSPDAAEIDVAHVRPMPLSPSYFSRHTQFNDSFVLIQDLSRKYGRLPFLPPGQAPRVAWKTKEQYRLAVGEAVKARDYAACIGLAKRLNQIHPDLMPEEVQQGLRPFKRDINFYLNRAKVIPIDRFGRSHGVGRRKSSVARAWLVQGTGEVLVNGKTLNDAFGRVHDRESALWGLKVMDRMDKYNVWALVEGGGTTGQAEALAMAVSKALAVHEPALKTPLKKAGCLTRDPRVVERKKPGHVKARKMPAWVKR